VNAAPPLDTSLEQGAMRAMQERIEKLEASLHNVSRNASVSILCFSDDWDRLFASFMVANGALAMGKEVHMFFTFWALAALRKKSQNSRNRSLMDQLLSGVLPAGAENTRLSKLNFCGLGKLLIRRRMKARGVGQLDQLIVSATELGVHIHVCEMAADLLGFQAEDLTGAEAIEMCGVASFLGHALNGQAVLFI
jgi:peroxiredoxin family protein